MDDQTAHICARTMWGAAPPGAAYSCAPGRSGQYADDILQGTMPAANSLK